MSAALCRKRFCRGVLEFRVIDGRVEEWCARCDRKARGICRDCPARVYGRVGWALRCETCARRARREDDARSRADADTRRRRNARWRKYARRPEVQARRRETRRAWRDCNPETVRRHKRRFLLRDGPAREHYLAYHRRKNADPVRAETKRRAALARYYELHPVRPDPHCTGCGVVIEWDGKGRPRKTCDRCCTPAELVRRRRGYNSKAYRERRGAA